jgi:hypothetical protein
MYYQLLINELFYYQQLIVKLFKIVLLINKNQLNNKKNVLKELSKHE